MAFGIMGAKVREVDEGGGITIGGRPLITCIRRRVRAALALRAAKRSADIEFLPDSRPNDSTKVPVRNGG